MTPSPPLPSVLVVPVRADARGHRSAERAADLLNGLARTRIAGLHDPAGLAELLATADHVVVLDPTRWRAAITSHPALGAPARAADRLALLRLLRERPGRVRWVGRPDQWERLRDVLLARAATSTPAVRS